jgi:metal-responsive CopG/Arc/MetJ family transcriptional regulator
MKKVLVSLPDGIVDLLDRELIGKVGEGRSDTLRQIILNWLSEQGYLAKGGKVEKSNC